MKLWFRSRRDEELDEEIRAHLAMAARDRLERGETPGDAQQNARRELGNELLIKEVTREMWGWSWLERFAQDLRYALRQMRRSPGVSVIAILTLALGLGATTAMFSIVNTALLEPLKYRDPARLYLARTLPPARAKLGRDFPVNARQFHEWRTHCRSCEDVSLIRFLDLTLVGAGQPVKLLALDVSYNFFRTLGIQPAMGRDFLPEDEQDWGKVILTDTLWRTRFAADPSILGRAIQLNGESHTVIGVMPPDLHLPRGTQWGGFSGPETDPLIFRPHAATGAQQARPAGSLNYSSMIRLKPGVSRQQGIEELNVLLADFARDFNLETSTTLIPLQDQMTRNARSALWLLLGAIGAVLLIACVNVGNLMLVRTANRYREAGVRLALGASRARLFGLVLKEAFLLVGIGGILGLGFAYAGLKLFVAAAPVDLPRLDEVGLNWRALAFSAFIIALSTLVCGIVPAWRLSRTEPLESLKAGSANSSEISRKLRFRELMVSVEVALSTMLLVVGGLLLFSFLRVMRVDKGFEVGHVIAQDVSFVNPKYSDEGRRRFVEEIVPKLAAIPGVRFAGAINVLPLRGEDWVSDLRDTDRPEPPLDQAALANFRFVTPDYFKTIGIPLKEGRFIEPKDQDRPVAVISERAAQHLWPGQNPLGKHVQGANSEGKNPALEVVGVVGEIPASSLERTPPMTVYEHYWRMQPVGMSFVLRTESNPATVVSSLRAVFSSADPELALSPAQTMEQIVDGSVAARRFQMYLAVAFALTALLLASLGVYGVISFNVARRTPEMGIRIALGARTMQLTAMILRQGLRPVVAGLAVGLVAALALGRFIATELYGVAPNDPWTMSAVAALLFAVAICACWIPARRASKIDPLRALRFE